MGASSSKGLKIYTTLGAAIPTSLIPTAITNAEPAEVTAADTTGMADGDVVNCVLTGFTELDGKSFIVGELTGTSFTLLGSDTSASTGILDVSPTIDHYAVADMQLLCLSSLELNVDEPGTVSTATYCDPSSTIPSAVQAAGTLAFAGFVDINDADYIELLEAVEDGEERIIRIDLPSNGYLIAPGTFSNIVWDLPLDGAIGYSGTIILSSKMRHVF